MAMPNAQATEASETTLEAVSRRIENYTMQVHQIAGRIHCHGDTLRGPVLVAIANAKPTANASDSSILGKLDALANAIDGLNSAVEHIS